jgi:hypothetical protein
VKARAQLDRIIGSLSWQKVLAGALMTSTAILCFRLGRHDPYLLALAWGLALMFSLVGWGEIVNVFLAPKRRADWALRAVWGLGVFLFLGGALSSVHLTSARVLVAQVAVGIAIFAWRTMSAPVPSFRRRALLLALANVGPSIVLFAAYAVSVLAYLGLAGTQSFEPSDDHGLYFTLVKKVLEQGSMVDPFDVRRISTFGGQIYLEAAFASVASMQYLNALDGGLFGIVLVGLIGGSFITRGLRPAHVVPMGAALVLVVFLLSVRVNTASLLSAACVHVGLYRTLHFSPTPGADRKARWPIEPSLLCVVALLTVTCFVLRTSNAIPVCAFVGILLIASYLSGARRPFSVESLRSFARMSVVFTAAFLAVLLPWSLMLRESCGTFFYPALGSGWVTPGFVFLKPVENVSEAAEALVANYFYDRPIACFPLFALAGLTLVGGRWRYDLLAMTLGTILGMTALILMGHQFAPPPLARYYFAYVTGTAIAVVLSVEPRAREGHDRIAWVRDALVLCAVVYHAGAARDVVKQQLGDYVKQIARAFPSAQEESAAWDARSEPYAAIQSHIEPGARVAVATEESFRFDFARNRIFSLDIPGGMGPPPGFPVFQGADALEAYLRQQRIRYLVYVDFTRANDLYNRAHWQGFLRFPNWYLAGEAPYLMDTETNIERLATRKAQVFKTDKMTLLDLDRPRE